MLMLMVYSLIISKILTDQTFTAITANIANGTFIINEPGRYLFMWSFNLDNTNNTTASAIVSLFKNGFRVFIRNS